MKKKLLILSASIGLILACFPFTLFAEEDPQSDLGVSPPSSVPLLDSYFYTNYDLLPYIESGQNQYIDIGINPDTNYEVYCKFSINDNSSGALFGSGKSSNNNIFEVDIRSNSSGFQVYFYNTNSVYNTQLLPFGVYDLAYKDDAFYFNDTLIDTFTHRELQNPVTLALFASHTQSGSNYAYKINAKIYSFSIYDPSADNGNGDYLRYYYPAKSKSGNIIGFYDAVTKTFVTSQQGVPFENPTDDKVIGFQISDFITAGLGWIGDILDFAIAEPMIIMFMAIGLAGAMFRWGRRLVHF